MRNHRTVLCVAALWGIAACADSNSAHDAGPAADAHDGGAGHGGSGGGQSNGGSGGHDSGGADSNGGNGGASGNAKVCEQLSNQSSDAVQTAIAAARTSCSVKSDCEDISVGTDCFASCGSLVSLASKKAAEAAIAAQNAGVCKDFAKAGCLIEIPPCPPPLPDGFDCIAGQCKWKSDTQGDDGGLPSDAGGSATGCVERAISWGPNGGFVAWQDRYELTPCREFALTRTPVRGAGMSAACANQVADDAAISVANVNAALAHADVKAAITAAPVLYGRDSRPVDGSVFRIEVGTAVIDLGDDCNGASGCEAIPAGLLQLRMTLNAMTDQQMVIPNCDGVP